MPERVKFTRPQIVGITCVGATIALYLLTFLAHLVDDSSNTGSQSVESPDLGSILVAPLFLMFWLVLYMGPTIIAYLREHQNSVPIMIVNIVFGWTGLGWFGSLAWAFSSNVRESRQYIHKVIVKERVERTS